MSNIARDVFKDFNQKNDILNCIIDNINLYKKSKKIGIELTSDSKIKLKDLLELEEYLKLKFNIEKIEFSIKYTKLPEFTLENDWQNIIKYVAKKMPIVKPIIMDSLIKVDNKNIFIILKTNTSEFLKSYKVDKALERLIFNLYGEKYSIKYEEKIDSEVVKSQHNFLEELEKEACKTVLETNTAIQMQNALQKKNETEQKDKEEYEEIKEKVPLILGRSDKIKETIVKIKDLTTDYGKVAIEGKIISRDSRELKNGKTLAMFNLYDGTSTITCKSFVDPEKKDNVLSRLEEAKRLKIQGNVAYDNYAKEIGVIANVIVELPDIEIVKRKDLAKEKRVELHMHTQMSQMDGMTSATDLIKRAASWGMKSIAITDHGVVQAFPEAKKAADQTGIKVVYGVEAYLVPDDNVIDIKNNMEEYCVLDIETTGLSFRTEKITEIGAVKVKNGEIIDTFECFVNPEIPIPPRIVELTGITDDMVENAENIEKVMPKFLEFIGNLKLVAHNADFDVGFLKFNAEKLGLSMNNEYIDTLALSRQMFPEFKKHKLGMIAEKLGITVENAHRALDDVITLVKVFKKMIEKSEQSGKNQNTKDLYKTLPSYHAIILVKNLKGLRNLYELISMSHLNYFYKKPRILTSLYNKYKEGLILGSACEQGELYRAIVARKIRRRDRKNCFKI